MDFVIKNDIKWLSILENTELTAGFSTRIGGYSKGSYGGLNIGLNTNDDASKIAKNRELLFKTIAPSMVDFYLNQTHSNLVHNIDLDSFKIFCNGDGLVTTQKNKLLCITIADCGSILFHDDKNSIVCAIHCGWKGTQLGIIQNALDQLSKYTDLENIGK